jgi:hypothetical protein
MNRSIRIRKIEARKIPIIIFFVSVPKLRAQTLTA